MFWIFLFVDIILNCFPDPNKVKLKCALPKVAAVVTSSGFDRNP